MTEKKQQRLVKRRLAIIHHAEEMAGNISQTAGITGSAGRRSTSGCVARRSKNSKG